MKNLETLLPNPLFTNCLEEGIQELFVDMVANPTKDVTCTAELINSAKNGKIYLDRPFNLFGYQYNTERNKKMNMEKKGQREKYIDTDKDFEKTKRTNGVQDNAIRDMSQISLEDEITDSAEVEYAIKSIVRVSDSFLVDEGIDLKVLLQRALSGVPNAVQTLKKVCEDFEILGEYIKLLLDKNALDKCLSLL